MIDHDQGNVAMIIMASGGEDRPDANHLIVVRSGLHAEEHGIGEAGGAGETDGGEKNDEESFNSEGVDAY